LIILIRRHSCSC